VRENMPIGAKVTLRKERMYEFLDRLVNIALPRVRDFRGLNPKSFDGRGNYAMGIKEHIVFPEINYDKVDQIWGMDIIVCTTAKTDDEARALCSRLSTSPSGSNGSETRNTKMAKTSSVEKNKRRRKLAAQYAGKRRALKAIVMDQKLRWKSASRLSSSSPPAAQRRQDPHPQPLRSDRPSARLLSQAQDVAYRAARTRLAGHGARPGQVELVRRV
jgi:hypothetical protein